MIGLVRAIGDGAWLTARAGRALATDAVEPDPLVARRVADALAEQMWHPLPLVAALGALAGVIAGIAAARLLALYHAELAVEPALAQALLRQVAPLVVGVFAAGRIAVGVANRLGGMALDREIDALEALGHDPVRFALAPQLGGVLAAVPVLTIAAGGAALAAAGLAIESTHATPFATFAHLVMTQASARALLGGMARVASFALVAFAVGATVGARGVSGAAELAAAGRSAFTSALLAVFALAALWTALS